MSRIFGIWNFKASKSEAEAACRKLLHTPSMKPHWYHQNVTGSGNESANALAYCGSEPGHFFQNEDWVVVVDGYLLNANELVRRYGVNPDSTAEMVAAGFEKSEFQIFEEIQGPIAVAILLRKTNRLILARDRFGMKPLVYTLANEGVAFASEVKALLALSGVKPRWEQSKFLQFVVHGATQDPYETFFKDITAVPPGCYLEIDLSSYHISKSRYYDLRKRIQTHAPMKATFEEVFSESVKKQMAMQGKSASLLSGGLDSSLIVAELMQNKDLTLQTFTASFPNLPIDESRYARMLAANTELEQHFVTPRGSDFLSRFDDWIYTQERPPSSASVFVQNEVMRFAAEKGANVLFDGQGADEIFGGYYPFAGAYLISLLKSGRVKKFNKEYRFLQSRFNPNMKTAMARAAFYSLPQAMQVVLRKKNRLGYNLIASGFLSEAKNLPSPERGGGNFLEMTFRSVEYNLYELLQYADKNASKYGIATRLPFLDTRVVEWAVSQPTGAKIFEGWTKYPIRKALEDYGFSELAWRKDKLGFVAPQDVWRKEYGGAFYEKIKSGKIREILDKAKIDEFFEAGISSNSGLSEFWRVVGLLRWMDVFEVELV